MKIIHFQQGLIDWALLIFFITPTVLMLSFLEPAKEWSSAPIDSAEQRLFSPLYEFHPHHYTMEEQQEMLNNISIIAMSYDPLHLLTFPAFFSFENIANIGEQAPDFVLATTTGDTFQLSAQKGKINAFMFVVLTCPPARLQLPKWQTLLKKYPPEDVQLFVIYSRERHPGEGGYYEYEHTKTEQQKIDNAIKLAALTDIKVVVDGINEKVLDAYGQLPNMAYVLDRNGIIVFKSTWADAIKIEQVIDSLMAFEKEKNVPKNSVRNY